ncbi:hypothetical protein PR001_g31280, partial [Phytophthora rubi]
RAAIPKHCFERSFVTSTYYMIQNVLTCAALFYAATFIDRTGAAAYLLEVVNNLIGLVLHSALLVPYHSWRISHRKHHSNTGSCKNDAVFVPMTRFVLTSSWNETLEDSPLYQLYRIAFMLVVGWMTGYLFVNATGPTKYWVAEPLQPELGHLRRPQVLDDRAERHLPRSHAARAGRARAHLLPPL